MIRTAERRHENTEWSVVCVEADGENERGSRGVDRPCAKSISRRSINSPQSIPDAEERPPTKTVHPVRKFSLFPEPAQNLETRYNRHPCRVPPNGRYTTGCLFRGQLTFLERSRTSTYPKGTARSQDSCWRFGTPEQDHWTRRRCSTWYVLSTSFCCPRHRYRRQTTLQLEYLQKC